MIFYFFTIWIVFYYGVTSMPDPTIINLEIKPDIGQINVTRMSLSKFNQNVEYCGSLNFKGNILKDLTKLIEIVNKSTYVILIQAYISPDSSSFIDCYAQTLLREISEKLATTIFTTSRLTTCFDRNFNENWILSNDSGIILTSVRANYYGKMLSDLMSTEHWNDVAVIYDHYEVFSSLNKAIEHSDKNIYFRLWTTNDVEMLQKLRHINIFILDLNKNALESFFKMASRLQIFNVMTTKIIIIERNKEFNSIKKIFSLISNITIILPVLNKFYSDIYINSDSVENLGFDYKLRNRFLNNLRVFLNNNQINEIYSNFSFIPPIAWIKVFGSMKTFDMPRIMNLNKNYFFDTSFEAVFLSENYFNKISFWSHSDGFVPVGITNQTKSKNHVINLDNKSLRVSTLNSPPFVIYKETDDNGIPLLRNSRFSGMAIDILEHLSQLNDFNYVLHLVKDSRYGVFNTKTGNWSGMIGEIINNDADMALGDITITYQRSRVVDFTIPWMNIGINAIIKKQPSRKNTFMNPFSISLWLMILGSYIIVSLTLFLVGKLSPFEWYKKSSSPNKMTNHFSVVNSFWYAVGPMRRESSDLTFRSVSTRMISIIWWIFLVFIIVSFSAMLVVLFLNGDSTDSLSTIKDLGRQTKIKYGTVKYGSTYSMFQKSNIEAYKRMGDFMRKNPSVLVNNYEEGIKRVLQEDYVFILESTMNEFYNNRNCELSSLAGRLSTRGYGIGLRSGNTLLQKQLSEGILRLEEDHVLESLRYKWFEVYGVSEACNQRLTKGSYRLNQITFENMQYLFITLIVLLIISYFVACCELVIWAYKQSSKNKNTFSSTICGQLRLAFCGGKGSAPALPHDPLLENVPEQMTNIA